MVVAVKSKPHLYTLFPPTVWVFAYFDQKNVQLLGLVLNFHPPKVIHLVLSLRRYCILVLVLPPEDSQQFCVVYFLLLGLKLFRRQYTISTATLAQ